jgi:hypothetical protein
MTGLLRCIIIGMKPVELKIITLFAMPIGLGN